jgi:uncharacterized protein with FMN-binding domain
MTKPIRRITYAALATVSGLVLLFSYRTSTGAEVPTTDAVAGSATSSTGSAEAGTSGNGASTPAHPTPSSTPSSAPTGSSSSGASSSGLQDGTYTGDSTDTRYGPVRVQISVSGGQIASVDVVDYPTDSPRDRQINQQAIPMLVSETTSAQSAQIDLISGATFTSQGYTQSLQSAIDQARS